jgi:hypothetical protein
MRCWIHFRPRLTITMTLLAGFLLVSSGFAQKYTAPSNPVIGSQNTVTADPPIARPNTTPCVVPLFSNYDFADFSSKSFTYNPPACAGPWAKVVLEADFSVDAGRQFDRTANIWIGGVNIYFGTTAEPSRTVSRNWHIENDLTDYSPLFTSSRTGRVDLGNLVNGTYTSILHGSAQLLFYPVASGATAPQTADAVLPLSSDSTGGSVLLFSPSDSLTRVFNLPTNIERAYLDVVAQGQSANDEFWYTCVPDALAGELQSCSGTAFRETEVSIDGKPAGVAPIYPWIFTGGIDPYLWRPIVGIQTLNFTPYRLDLSPFAALLNDGQPHSVSLNVFNDHVYFSTTASLLLYLDHGSTQVTGALTANTVGMANPSVATDVTADSSGNVTGTVNVTSNRQFKLAGYVNTSHGTVETDVVQHIDFKNSMQFDITSNYLQDIVQNTQIGSTTTRTSNGQIDVNVSEQQWPLRLNYSFVGYPDGSAAQIVSLTEGYSKHEVSTGSGRPAYVSDINVTNSPADTLVFSTTTFPQDQTSTERYQFKDNRGGCWDHSLTASAGVLTAVSDGCTK